MCYVEVLDHLLYLLEAFCLYFEGRIVLIVYEVSLLSTKSRWRRCAMGSLLWKRVSICHRTTSFETL